MEKLMIRPYIKYNSIIALALLTINASVFFDLDGLFLVFSFYVYIPIILIAAPIVFGFCYGRYLSKNYLISFKNTIKIACMMFGVSCVTYGITFYRWLLGIYDYFNYSLNLIFFPATLITFVFLCSVTMNQIVMKRRIRKSL